MPTKSASKFIEITSIRDLLECSRLGKGKKILRRYREKKIRFLQIEEFSSHPPAKNNFKSKSCKKHRKKDKQSYSHKKKRQSQIQVSQSHPRQNKASKVRAGLVKVCQILDREIKDAHFLVFGY